MGVRTMIGRLSRSPEAWTTAATAVRLAGGILILPWALRLIPDQEMGIWYIWGSLGAIAALADFGFASTVSRAAAFYTAGGNSFQASGLAEGGKRSVGPNFLKLNALAVSARRLYIILGVSLGFLLMGLGFFFVFRQIDVRLLTPKVKIAWWVFVATCAFSLYGRWQSAFVTGVGRVIETARLTVLAQFVYLVVVAVALRMGGGLVALAAGQALPTLILNVWLNRRIRAYRGGVRSLTDISAEVGVRVLWPTAWRYGLVMIGSYFINNTAMLVCAHYLSLGETASFGLANQTVNMLMGVCFGVMQVRVPEMVAHRTNRRMRELHRLVGRQLIVSCALFIVGAIGLLVAGPILLRLIASKTTLPALGLLGFFIAYRFLELHQSYFAIVVMTENRVPFVLPALVSGFAIVGLAMLVAPTYGLFGVMLATAIVQSAYNNWWTVWRGLQGLGCSYCRLYRAGGGALLGAL